MIQKHASEGPAELRSIWKVAARVPWPAVLSVCLYLPGIVLWSVYSLRCKASTFVFLSTVAPVSSETVETVTSTVNTTLITLAAGGTFIFALLLVLAIARSIQVAGVAPKAFCPCARPTLSSFYMYRIFNLGFNIIVLFVDMAIILLMMGAFLWLVVAYAANVSMKFGVRDARASGIDPQQQFNLANQNYSTVVSYYQQQLRATPPCVVNTTWFKGLNRSISSILAPAPDANSGSNTLLCPQSCLNLGSFATLFKLSSNCICDQEQLYRLQDYSMTVSTEAGVALGGSILIYLACTCLHAYLTGQYVHAGYDYRAAKQHYAELVRQRRRRRQGHSSGSASFKGGPDSGGGGPPPAGPGRADSNDVGWHSHSYNGSSSHGGSGKEHPADDGHHNGPGRGQHYLASDVGWMNGVDDVEMGVRGDSGSRRLGKGASAAAAAAVGSAVAPKGSNGFVYSCSGDVYETDQQPESRPGSSMRGASAAQQLGPRSGSEADNARYHSAARDCVQGYSRQSSGGSSAVWNSGHAAVHGMQRSRSAGSGGGAGTAPAAVVSAGWQLGQSGSQRASTPADQASLGRISPVMAPLGLSSVDEQQQLLAQGLRQPPAAATVAAPGRGFVHSSSLHSRSESRSSAGSIREILLGTVPLDQPSAGHSTAASRSAADGLPANSGGSFVVARQLSNNSGSSHSNGEQGQLVLRDSREGRIHHKSSSSSGSYDSMIYHSPHTSDCGGAGSPAAAGAALAGAAAAAGVLDLSPAGLKRMQQQQQERQRQQQGAWSVLNGGGPATILESSSEQLTGSPAQQASAHDTGQAPPADPAAEPAARAAADAGSFYDSYTSTHSTGGMPGSQTGSGSGRRSRQSHRRLLAFDLTNLPANFLTVEGLEEQQELAKSAANTRPCSPAAATGGGAGGLVDAAAAALAAAAAQGGGGSSGGAAADGAVQAHSSSSLGSLCGVSFQLQHSWSCQCRTSHTQQLFQQCRPSLSSSCSNTCSSGR
ncbi:hypothetical protein COO60DRAFT_318071 [Scenedesmus sp. NREL 46B-D3]|nr:hypothetical protein COO60DRAFT_318071 [Scenedesmus sp. NREL 46B-D3]